MYVKSRGTTFTLCSVLVACTVTVEVTDAPLHSSSSFAIYQQRYTDSSVHKRPHHIFCFMVTRTQTLVISRLSSLVVQKEDNIRLQRELQLQRKLPTVNTCVFAFYSTLVYWNNDQSMTSSTYLQKFHARIPKSVVRGTSRDGHCRKWHKTKSDARLNQF